MNNNERAILKILSKNPTLSQNSISKTLGITRSSVSVYISNLITKGYILGRGYLLNDEVSYVVIGAAVVDHRTVIDTNMDLEDSTLTFDNFEFNISYGGAARNISESLMRLGINNSCIFAVGDDLLGRSLVDECKTIGMDVNDIYIIPACKTSTYLEIRSTDQSKILLSSANIKLQKYMTPEFFIEKQHKLKRAEYIITEDGLSVESLQYLSSSYSSVILVGIKTGRIKNYRDFINQFRGIVLSIQIACELLNVTYLEQENDEFVLNIAYELQKIFHGTLLMCYGFSKFYVHTEEHSILCNYSSNKLNSALYSHYRDAVASGFVSCLINGIHGNKMLKYVSACREISADSDSIISQILCQDLVDKTIDSLSFVFHGPLKIQSNPDAFLVK